MIVFHKPIVFEWDRGNSLKNWEKHRVKNEEAEEIFFDHRKRMAKDSLHSGNEKRYLCVGKTKKGRLLFVVFTIRALKVRVISARQLNKREIKLYEEKA